MDILIIPAFFQDKKRPTLGSFFVEQAKALKNNGDNVTILYCDTYSVKCFSDWLKYEEVSHQVSDGIDIYRKKIFCPLKHGIKGHREAFSRGISQLYMEYIQGHKNIDIIHAHCCVWAGYAAMELSQKTNIPYVITEHATLFQLHRDEINPKEDKYIAKAFKNAGKVVCVSDAFAGLLSDYRNKNDIAVIGNVVDCELFQVKDKMEMVKKEREFTFLTICYMEEEAQLYKKGIDILIKSWAELIKNYPDSRLIIGGGGRCVSKVIEWCRDYNVESSVEFVGALDRKQVVRYMQDCDCFVLPSRYETFGVVYIEAFACGKPVIGVKNGGPDDFVNDTNGILIPLFKDENDIEVLVSSMKEIIENIDKYDSGIIRRYVEERFSADAIAKQLHSVYNEVLCK